MSVCANCGKENQVHYKYCLGCGAELDGHGGPAPSAPSPAAPKVAPTVVAEPKAADDNMLDALASALEAAPKTSPGTSTSPVWEAPSADSWASAAGGGAAASAFDDDSPGTQPRADLEKLAPSLKAVAAARTPQSTKACPSCGNIVPVEFSFCGQCGARLEVKPQTAPRPQLGQQPMVAAGPRGKLILIRPDGSEGGAHGLEEGENAIGRGFGPLFDADGYLSPRHAELVLNVAGCVIHDTNSLNGVFVRIHEEEELDDGDVFRIGQELLRFDAIHPPEPLDDGTEILGSPNPGYWGRLAVVVGQDQDGSAFPLFGDALVLGRERGDLVFPEDGYVSGTHARVSYRDGRYYLQDLNSSNGTFLRIRGERVVPSGTFLLMGQQLFRIVFQ